MFVATSRRAKPKRTVARGDGRPSMRMQTPRAARGEPLSKPHPLTRKIIARGTTEPLGTFAPLNDVTLSSDPTAGPARTVCILSHNRDVSRDASRMVDVGPATSADSCAGMCEPAAISAATNATPNEKSSTRMPFASRRRKTSLAAKKATTPKNTTYGAFSMKLTIRVHSGVRTICKA